MRPSADLDCPHPNPPPRAGEGVHWSERLGSAKRKRIPPPRAGEGEGGGPPRGV